MKLDAFLRQKGPADVPRLARAAEETGFDGIWFGETKHDALLLSALAAEHTDRVSVGTAIALAFSRSPTALAYTAWDVQALSRGRFILGLGSQVKGHMERRFGVEWVPPRPKMREVVQALRAVWATWQEGTPLDFRGDHFSLNLMTPFFNPGSLPHPEIPIYLAAVNPGMASLAGEVADGVHGHPLHTASYLREVLRPAVARGAERAGRDPDEVTLAAPVFVVTGSDAEELDGSREIVRRQLAFYASTRTYRPVLEHHGWGALCDELHKLSVAGRWAEMGNRVPDEVLAAFAVEGKHDELPDLLVAKYRGLLDRLALYFPFKPEDPWWPGVVAGLHAH